MKKYIEVDTDRELSTWGLYEEVFQDMVESYLADKNYELDEDDEERIELNDAEIKKVANILLYKDEPLWERINDSIWYAIEGVILKRKEK